MATSQKGENPVKSPDQQQPQPQPQPTSDPPSNNNAAPPTRQQPHTDLSRQDGDQSKTSETGGAAAGSTAVKDSKDEPVSNIQRKIRRAERFGMPVQLSEEEKRNSRAERFGSGSGSTVHGSDALKKSEEQKRKARAERFGLVQSEPVDEDAKKKARLARFGAVLKTDPLEEDKKKARAIRFSQPTSGSVSQVNGKGNNIEMKTAIAGKAGGAN